MSALQSFPRRLGPILAALATACAMPPAAATETETSAGADTRWLCWPNRDTTIRCRLLAAAGRPTVAANRSARADHPPDPYPRRGPLPPIVDTIVNNPGQLHGRTITIPMFSEPEEMAFAEQLAHAVMCGGRASCEVEFARSLSAVALLTEDDPALD